MYKEEIVQHGSSKVGPATALGWLGAVIGGPIGGILGATIGAVIGTNQEEITRQVEITNPCIRCGGKGHVTARLDERTGFQCPTCKNFWKVPDYKLPPEDLIALKKIDFANPQKIDFTNPPVQESLVGILLKKRAEKERQERQRESSFKADFQNNSGFSIFACSQCSTENRVPDGMYYKTKCGKCGSFLHLRDTGSHISIKGNK